MPATVPIPHPLPDQLVELIAQRFRVLGEPMRIKLLDRLRDGEATVGELQEATGCLAAERLQAPGRAAAGRHGRAGRRGAPRRVYAIADDGVFELCEQVCGGLRRQLAELDAILAGRPARMSPLDLRPQPAGRSSACSSRWPAP